MPKAVFTLYAQWTQVPNIGWLPDKWYFNWQTLLYIDF